MSKNIEYLNGGQAKVGDRVKYTVKNPREGDKVRTGILMAVNAEVLNGNGRIVFDDLIAHLPAVDISGLELVKSETTVGSEPLRNEQGLRTDGPTLKEFTDAGYSADKYPPQGYTDKRTPEELESAKTVAATGAGE